MAISERIQLLAKYDNIPSEISVSSIQTDDELRYVGDESYISLMLDTLFPKVIAEKFDFRTLLEIDFHWICRCLRILSFGPIHTTNSIFCDLCHNTSYGEYKVNLNSVRCIPVPQDNPTLMKLHHVEFIDFDQDVFFKLLTIGDVYNLSKDEMFMRKDGRVDTILGKMCYMIRRVGDRDDLEPKQVLSILKDEINSADYHILRGYINSMVDYGLRSGGTAQCPKCGSQEAAFIALPDDRYYVRPWEIYGNGYTVNVNGKDRTYREIRQQMYENIIDETLFISRASESAVSANWLMTQPVFLRKKYVESFTKELQERERSLKRNRKTPHR